ncbi:right-handed parallel beta-helix repeat-containing protein [Colwellia sp. RE-S-Sl-9]
MYQYLCKKRNITTSLILSTLLFPCSIYAKNIYVAIDGNDNNDGSINSPYSTFEQANDVLEAGDNLIIKAGTYRQTLRINKNGTEQNRITVKAEEGSTVVISGTEPVTGWSQFQDDIYQANITMSIDEEYRQLYHNSKLVDIARWPNNTDGDVFTIDAADVSAKGTVSSVSAQNIPDTDLSNGYIWYLGAHSGTSWTRKITSSTDNSVSFTAINDAVWPFNPHAPTILRHNNYGRFFVFGKLALLDHANEWFYDPAQTMLYLQASDGLEPVDNTVEISARENTIILDGGYITVEGIEAFGGNVVINGANNTIRESKITYGLQRLDELDNTDAQVGSGSITVYGQHTRIENNTIEHGSLNGIFVAGWGENGKFVHIEGNIIRYFDTLGIHASPIRVTASNATIIRNTLSDTGRDGVFLPSQNSEFAYNDVSKVGLINNDGGVFYTVGNNDDKNTRLHHNWLHDSAGPAYADGRTAGIYLDNNSKGYQVDHNVVWNVTWSGVQLNWENNNNNIYHNTFINVGQAMGEWINGHTRENNRVWNNYADIGEWLMGNAYDLDSNEITSDAQLIAPENSNFMLLDSSILIDKARIIDGFDKAYAGPSPDIGAYELGGIKWTAGINAIFDDCTECSSNPNSEPVIQPPVVEPPVVEPPVVEPPEEPVVVEPPVTQPIEQSSDGSSGGSLGLFSLLSLFGLLLSRRRTTI